MENKANLPEQGANLLKGFKRKKPEYESGDYFFTGKFYVTAGVQATVHPDEIFRIYMEMLHLVSKQGGQDYLQVYTHKSTKLFLIDNLSREMIQSGNYSNEDNSCTLLLADEYWNLSQNKREKLFSPFL